MIKEIKGKYKLKIKIVNYVKLVIIFFMLKKNEDLSEEFSDKWKIMRDSLIKLFLLKKFFFKNNSFVFNYRFLGLLISYFFYD